MREGMLSVFVTGDNLSSIGFLQSQTNSLTPKEMKIDLGSYRDTITVTKKNTISSDLQSGQESD